MQSIFKILKGIIKNVIHRFLYKSCKIISAFNDKDIAFKELFPNEKFELPLQRDIYGKKNPNFLSHTANVPSCNIFYIKNGRCIVGGEECFNSKNEIIKEISSQKDCSLNSFRIKKFRKIEKLNFRVVNLSLSGLENNYYHFWVEWYLRFWIISRHLKPDSEVRYILPEITNFQKQFIELLGISEDKILKIEKGTFIQSGELITATLINNWEKVYYNASDRHNYQKQYLPTWTKLAYEKFKVLDNTNQNKYIYISRKKAPFRKLINELEITEYLQTKGFEIYFLEDMSLKSQIELFNNAKIVISVHGAGLTNLIFSNPEVKVLEIFPQQYHDWGYRILFKQLGLKYYYIIGQSPLPTNDVQKQDVSITLEDINYFLKVAL